jgi:phosphonate transport system substrate-binding protein
VAKLKLASWMAENAEPFCAAVADHLTEELHIAVEYVNDGPWQERERRFDAGMIQILWLCGLPYVEKADQCGLDTELLAVPVPVGERYRGRPAYFSDVIVRNDSQYESLFDLRGARWAYNEPRSHSGYNVVRAYLAEFAQHQEFFGAAIESGAHSASLEMVLSGAVDGAAIDSTVLEWYFAHDDERAARLRVLDTLGPSPMPPWVVSTRGHRAVAWCYPRRTAALGAKRARARSSADRLHGTLCRSGRRRLRSDPAHGTRRRAGGSMNIVNRTDLWQRHWKFTTIEERRHESRRQESAGVCARRQRRQDPFAGRL